jgi:microcystin-dependent protein
MALTFFTTSRFGLRALKGGNLVADIDAGFEALANDIDAALYPPGDLRFTARINLDAGWLRCEGQEVSRAANAALFAAISTSYGVGDGATTFNLPDYRGRVPVAAGAGPGLSARALGAKVGEEAHQLTSAEVPATNVTGTATGGAGVWTYAPGGGGATNSPGAPQPMNVVGSLGLTAHVEGGGGSHNNMQPSTVCNVWIKT